MNLLAKISNVLEKKLEVDYGKMNIFWNSEEFRMYTQNN
jgi:hypothetical protein